MKDRISACVKVWLIKGQLPYKETFVKSRYKSKKERSTFYYVPAEYSA